ncbi:hypothetical protein L5515_007229 [Caenorhabditis briggsae]|uniref:F-box domain-containing protein n=1 Tax=Caenorhabditis briggsae TaxID=6238 RepID=A0AAE9JJ59_CAEBR|nr:hypothetical protein L5515_007229 [Caenorhabditis briggsae]
MLLRVREVLSKKFPRWVFDERSGPLDWSILPMEMKREIVKHTDFETRCRLRQCSKQDQQIVESLKVGIPFIQIESDKNFASAMIFESETKVIKVEVSKKLVSKLSKKPKIKISDNIEGANPRQIRSCHDFDAIVDSLLRAIYRDNVSIDSLNLILKYSNDIITNYLDTHYREQFGPRRKTKITCSGVGFLVANVYFLPIDETRVFNPLVTNYEEGRMMMAEKTYNVAPSGHLARLGPTTFWKPSLLNCNLGALIAGIIWKINTEMERFFIPGLEVPEYQEYCNRFEGRVTRHGKFTALHIPVGDQDNEKKLIIKMSACGVLIEKKRFEDVAIFEEGKCILGWLCSKCDKSVESWYFRETHFSNKPV